MTTDPILSDERLERLIRNALTANDYDPGKPRYFAALSEAIWADRFALRTRIAELEGFVGPHHQRCQSCGRADGVDFGVPDKLWADLVPEGGVLCLPCFDKRAVKTNTTYELTHLSFNGHAGHGIAELGGAVERLKADTHPTNEELTAIIGYPPVVWYHIGNGFSLGRGADDLFYLRHEAHGHTHLALVDPDELASVLAFTTGDESAASFAAAKRFLAGDDANATIDRLTSEVAALREALEHAFEVVWSVSADGMLWREVIEESRTALSTPNPRADALLREHAIAEAAWAVDHPTPEVMPSTKQSRWTYFLKLLREHRAALDADSTDGGEG